MTTTAATLAALQVGIAQILDKLERIERAVSGPSNRVAKTSAEAVLREKLTRLTLKRHAALTASLSDVSYQEMAKLMQCDVTTVKLHLKAAMNAFDIPTRSILLSSHKGLIEGIPDAEYKKVYGISKRWWLEQDKDLMAVLTSTKPTANQHTQENQ